MRNSEVSRENEEVIKLLMSYCNSEETTMHCTPGIKHKKEYNDFSYSQEFIKKYSDEIYLNTGISNAKFHYDFLMKIINLGLNTGMSARIDYRKNMLIILTGKDLLPSNIRGLIYAKKNKIEMKFLIRKVIKRREGMIGFKPIIEEIFNSENPYKILNPITSFVF